MLCSRAYDNYAICLIAVLCGKFAMSLQHLFARKQVFTIPCAMGSNLCGARTLSSDLLQVLFDLFSPWTGCFQIFLRIALDFRLAMLAAFDLIAQP